MSSRSAQWRTAVPGGALLRPVQRRVALYRGRGSAKSRPQADDNCAPRRQRSKPDRELPRFVAPAERDLPHAKEQTHESQ